MPLTMSGQFSTPAGLMGTDHITNTAAHSRVAGWSAITAIAAAAAVIEGENLSLNGTAAPSISLTIPEGVTIRGIFTKITLGSGSVIANRL
jgi:hypothetical protein